MSNLKDLFQFRNCEVAFKCDADWFELDETSNEKIRFCNSCQKPVHLCIQEDELLAAIKSNLCVAIPPPFKKSESRNMFVGSAQRIDRSSPNV
jgi:hypothetical protein